jgi:exopolysaccharide production protein ExoF
MSTTPKNRLRSHLLAMEVVMPRTIPTKRIDVWKVMRCLAQRRVRRIAVARTAPVFAYLVLSLLLPIQAFAGPYRLGVQDKLRIKVIEWRAGKGEYQEWTALGAEYTVNAAGKIALPLVGEIPAEGKTTEEVAESISEGLQKRAGLINRLDASVEVVQYRPIYLLGNVERPGEYAYRPGVSVLQAVGIAGGFHRPTEGGLLRLERDRIAASGSYESARLELRRMIARRARLEAELGDATTIKAPEEFRSDPDSASLLAEETSLLVARSDALKSQLLALSELSKLYLTEIESLEGKKVAQERQVSLAQRELKNVGALVQKGLAVSSREFGLERLLADLESKMLDIETALVRAKQELRKVERDSIDLVKDRKAKTATELRETRASIEQLVARLRTSNALINETLVTAPRLALERSAANAQTPIFSIMRKVDGTVVQRTAHEATIVEPGDVVRVDAALGDSNIAAPALGSRSDTDSQAMTGSDHASSPASVVLPAPPP